MLDETASIATTTTLLNALHNERDDSSWHIFDRRYRPILLRVARRFRLDDSDAADVAQETLERFVREYRAGRYDRTAGRLRTWLLAIARYRILDVHRARARHRSLPLDEHVDELAREDDLERAWEAEQHNHIINEALAELRRDSKLSAQTIKIFECVAIRQQAPAEVAAALGISRQEVYDARSRVHQRLSDCIVRIQSLFDAD